MIAHVGSVCNNYHIRFSQHHYSIYHLKRHLLNAALWCALSWSADRVSRLLQWAVKPHLASTCSLFFVVPLHLQGKDKALKITTCRHSDISLDIQQWAVRHSPVEKGEMWLWGRKQCFVTGAFTIRKTWINIKPQFLLTESYCVWDIGHICQLLPPYKRKYVLYDK